MDWVKMSESFHLEEKGLMMILTQTLIIYGILNFVFNLSEAYFSVPAIERLASEIFLFNPKSINLLQYWENQDKVICIIKTEKAWGNAGNTSRFSTASLDLRERMELWIELKKDFLR